MKFYLLFPLFFLGSLSLPISLFSQENQVAPHSAQTENPTDHSSVHPHSVEKHSDTHAIEHDLEQDLPVTWSSHAPSEADTFQTKFFNMLFILGLLIGFMILASWALKRMMKSKMTQLNTASSIKVLETRYLSPRATLYLVEIEDQSFLIAESPTSVTYLATLPVKEEDTSFSSQNVTPPPFPGAKNFKL